MPMPGSQEFDSIEFAYFLNTYKWIFRFFLLGSLIYSFQFSLKSSKFFPFLFLVPTFIIYYIFNFVMTADSMFLQPNQLVFKDLQSNKINSDRLVVVVSIDNISKAYPFL